MKKLLVLGVGNILMMDEGIGVHAVHELLKEKYPGDYSKETLDCSQAVQSKKFDWAGVNLEHVDFIDGGTFTQDIFYLFVEYEKILVLDIVKGGQAPGTIYRLSENDLRQDQKQTLSLHDIDLLDSLSMARMTGKNPELHVLGIEPETINWSIELTPTLAKLFPHYVELVREEIISLLKDTL
ncbi:MAG: HyaD/HybD family hydrogenase maturation endopeptidase [Desulfamplus sp.]|nr:HyaD/HybD family hydrogenase maturation endopeptidase [Desulfamplus sp.]